jgi:hypothetical protein
LLPASCLQLELPATCYLPVAQRELIAHWETLRALVDNGRTSTYTFASKKFFQFSRRNYSLTWDSQTFESAF